MIYKLNLLPEELRKVKTVDPKRLLYKYSLYAFLAIIILIEITYGWLLWSIKHQTGEAQKEIQNMQNTVEQVRTLTVQNEGTKQKIAVFEKLSPHAYHWSDLLESIAAAMPENVWLTHFAINDKRNLIFEGHADKLTTLGSFMEGLRSVKGLKNINLTSATNNMDGIRFILTVEQGD